jgi:hypothetical protein
MLQTAVAIGEVPQGLGRSIMSVVSAMSSGVQGDGDVGSRRVRARVALPIVAVCALLGVVAGVVFPLPAAMLSAVSAPIPKHGSGSGQAKPTKTPQSSGEALPSVSPIHPDPSLSTPQEQARSGLTRAESPLVVTQKPDPLEEPSQAASRAGERRHRAQRKNVLSDRMRHGKRERSAALRRRPRAPQGQFSQLPIVGPVAGAILP